MNAPPRTTGTSVGMFAIVAVIWWFSVLVVGAAAYGAGLLVGGRPLVWGMVAGLAWTASALLLLVRPLEAGVARLLYRGLRRPGPAELERIVPAFRRVCRRAGADPGRYLLRVQEQPQVNAFALGGHLVAVTRVALELDDGMLEAVLAHELGHHLHLHPLATSLGWWYLLPFAVAEGAWRRIGRATRAMARAFARLRGDGGGAPGGLLGLLVALGALVLVGTVLVVVLCVLWLPLLLLVRAARLLGAGLSRAGERAADRHAVQLGYGADLVAVLELFVPGELASPRPRGLAALLQSHPSCQARLAAIRADG
ncbi:MAG TPA: M48 family metalloprotease [Actinomycetes bacterium]|jgi:STE24 endopeptidase|nr:M48 family metalloprotease [Actinomycetes bacterium]